MGTFHPAPAESTSAEQTAVPEETTVPEQTTVPEDTTVAATAVPEAEEALQMQQGGWGARGMMAGSTYCTYLYMYMYFGRSEC